MYPYACGIFRNVRNFVTTERVLWVPYTQNPALCEALSIKNFVAILNLVHKLGMIICCSSSPSFLAFSTHISQRFSLGNASTRSSRGVLPRRANVLSLAH